MTITITQQEQQEIEQCRLENASAMASGGCGVCERKDYPLLLVRKSIVPLQRELQDNQWQYSRSFADTQWSKNMVSLGEREPAEPLVTNEYAFRFLRGGYLYIFLRTRGTSDKAKRAVLGYEVTPSGCFRHKRVAELLVDKSHQINEIPSSCTKANHHIPAKLINLNNVRYSHAWIAYSPHPWSEQTVEHYRSLPESQMQRFTLVELPEKASVKPTQLNPDGRSFSALDFFNQQRYLMELECDEFNNIKSYYDEIGTQSRQGEPDETQDDVVEFNPNFFYSATPFYSLKKHKMHLENHIKSFNTMPVAAVVVEDCFGLAEELAVQKHIAITPHIHHIHGAEAQLLNQSGEQFKKAVGDFSLPSTLLKREQYALASENEALYSLMYPDSESSDEPSPRHQDVNQKMVEYAKQQLVEKQSMGPSRFDYYSKEMIYKRRFLSNILHYEQGIIEEFEHDMVPEKLIAYFYRDAHLANTIPTAFLSLGYKTAECQLKHQDQQNIYIGTSHDVVHLPEHYQLKPLTEAEKQQLLLQFNQLHHQFRQGWQPVSDNDDIVKMASEVRLYAYQPKPYQAKLNRYRELLNQPLIAVFKEELTLSYQWMMDDINLLMQDYFYYCTWLIGSGEAKSHFSPALKRYNSVPFWQDEVVANGGHAHAGYLRDAIDIFQPEPLGTIKLDAQFGLWDNLLRDENTFYLHLFNGKALQPSLWNALLMARDKPENAHKSSDELVDALYHYSAVQPPQAGASNDGLKQSQAVIAKLDALLDLQLPNDPNQTKFVCRLFDTLCETGYRAIANMPNGAVLNRLLSQQHLAESANVLFGAKVKIYRFNVAAKDLRYAMNHLHKANPALLGQSDSFSANLSQGKGKNITLLKDEKGWQIAKAHAKSVVTVDVVTVAASAAEAADIEQQFAKASTLKQFVTRNPYVTHMDGEPLTRADMDAAFNLKRRQIKIEEGKSSLFSGLLLALTVYNLSSQYGQYDLTIAEDMRDKMRREMSRGILDALLFLPPLAYSGHKLMGMGYYRFFRSSVLDMSKLSRTSKLLGLGNRFAGITGAVAMFYDGASSCIAGYQRYQDGDDGAGMYLVGSVCQMTSAALAALAVIFKHPLLAILALIFGVAAWILLELYRDASDEWSLMQKWFNRCYFGRWSHRRKGDPYPFTQLGYSFALNDYWVALLNCGVNIALEDGQPAPGDETALAQQIVMLAGYSAKRKLQLNLFLSDFDRNNSAYVGRVLIRSKYKSEQFVVLKLSDEPEYINVEQESSSLDEWTYRSMVGIDLKTSKTEFYNISTNKEAGSNISFLIASQILGWVEDSIALSKYRFEVVMHYYRDKTKDDVPIVLNYEYE